MRFANQHDLFAEQAHLKRAMINDPLMSIAHFVDFTALAAEIDRLFSRPDGKKGERPRYQTEVMVRIACLRWFCGLSYEQTAYQLLDRASFKRFALLDNSSNIPVHATIWEFEQDIGEAGAKVLFDAFAEQLNAHGFYARCGQMIDGTLVLAPIQHFKKKDKVSLENGEVPKDWSACKKAQKDLDATHTKKHSKSYHGYKMSVNVDVKHKMIRKVEMSTASVHDSKHFESLLDKTNPNADVYADKGYASKAHTELLKQEGDHIQRKGARNHPLSATQKRRNHRISKTRSRVEHPFGSIRQMNGKVLRTIGLSRAKFGMSMMALCYNIKRLVRLQGIASAGFVHVKTV